MRTFLAFILFALTASAQSYSALTLGTNAVPNGTTNSTAGTSIEVLRQTSATVFASAKCLTNAGIGTLSLVFQGSPDDSTYFTNAYQVDLTLNGTNTVYGFAHFDLTPFKHFKQTSILNSSTNVATNITASILLK